MKIIEKLKTNRKLLLIVIGLIIATLIVPYLTIPGLILWWFYRKSKFSRKFKTISTSVVGELVVILMTLGIIAYAKDIEPHLTVSEPASATSIKSQQIAIKGTYDPTDRKVWVNGKEVTTSDGSFEMQYQLKEGENKIEVTAGNWKRAHVYLTVTRELTDEEKAARATPTPTPKPTTTAVQEPTKAPTVVKQANPTPTPTPTAKPKAITPPPTITYDINGFPKNAEQVTVSDIAKTPNAYADGITNVVFTCKIISFARDDQGNATAVNCADPNDMSSIVQIDIGNFDIKRINVSDTIRIYGFVMGVFKGKNGFGVEITEAAVSGMYINDLTSGYNSTK